MDYSNFKDKVFIITGGGGACGGCTAVELVRNGACVALIDIVKERLNDVAKRCVETGAPHDKVLTYVGDTSNDETCKDFIEKTVSKFNRIDGLYNIVGKKVKGTIHTATWEGFEAVYRTGLKSTFTMSQLCLPHLKETKGTILNMSGIAGVVPCYHALSYGVFLTAIYRFTEAIAHELAPYGIRVNGISPACVKDPYYHKAMSGMSDEQLQAYFDWMADVVPLGWVSGPEEIAKASLFLLSDKSSYTTGFNMPVTGSYENGIAIP